jgi:4-carboxymuconolactone decarboxylase
MTGFQHQDQLEHPTSGGSAAQRELDALSGRIGDSFARTGESDAWADCLPAIARHGPTGLDSVLAMTDESEFDKGLKIRREVLGDAFVDANLAGTNGFMMVFQHLVTELAWARAWGAATLDRKTKSLLSLGILAASGRFQEVGIYAKGALNSGATVDEITEVLTHVTIYCGTPAGRQSFLAVNETLKSEGIVN